MRKVLKWAGYTAAGLFALVLLLGVSAFGVGKSRATRVIDVESRVSASTAPGAIERGAHIAATHGCLDCHTPNMGGQEFLDIPPGLFVASNLTPGKGGVGEAYGPGDWDRAVRFGVRHDGTSLIPMMPYPLFNNLSDADMADLAAFLEALPPVDNDLPKTKLRLPGYFMLASPAMNLAKIREGLTTPYADGVPAGATAEYGKYLAAGTCVECHGPNLTGGKHPDPSGPPAPSLIPAGHWPFEDFQTAMRTGVAPGNRTLSDYMPWKSFGKMDDVELAALHAYLGTLQAGG